MKAFFAIFFSFWAIFLTIFCTNCFYGTFFPIKYQEEIDVCCKKYDVDPAVVFSLINIESHFNKNAISSKGAVGLMQVMPTTAKGISKDVGKQEFDLFDAQDNIEFGVCYFAQLQDRFGDLHLALCAYNAGPTNVSNWLKNEKYSTDGKTLSNIPFSETENYLKKFERNFRYYSTKIK